MLQDGFDFLAGQDHRECAGLMRAYDIFDAPRVLMEHDLVQKQDSAYPYSATYELPPVLGRLTLFGSLS